MRRKDFAQASPSVVRSGLKFLSAVLSIRSTLRRPEPFSWRWLLHMTHYFQSGKSKKTIPRPALFLHAKKEGRPQQDSPSDVKPPLPIPAAEAWNEGRCFQCVPEQPAPGRTARGHCCREGLQTAGDQRFPDRCLPPVQPPLPALSP